MKSFIAFLISGLSIIIILSGCAKKTEPLIGTRFFIGTICSISLYDNQDKDILDKAFARIEALEKLLSANETGTEVDIINQNAGIKETSVSEETFYLIKRGLDYSAMSGGLFDITIGHLTSLWHIGSSKAKIPEAYELESAIELINYLDIELNEADKTVFLKKAGMKLDMGAIAKGYIADEAARVLLENGVESAVINLGGNIIFLGYNDSGTWSGGVRNPMGESHEIIGVISCINKSLVTSGIYERYFENEGVRYHHILNPSTGYPFDNELASVVIVHDKSVDADALSTIAFTKGLSEGMAFIEGLADVEALFITKEYGIYLTGGLKDSFKLTNRQYKIME